MPSGSKVITDPGKLGPDLLELSLHVRPVGHGCDGTRVGRISVVVSPGARSSEVIGAHGDGWKVRVAAPAEGGRANAALCRLLADALGVPAAGVRVVAGASSRRKLVEVAGLDANEIADRLGRLAR
jgi:uncharacterized protein (TIGR00251 family)